MKNCKHEYQNNFSKALTKYLTHHAFSKVFIASFEYVLVNWDSISGKKLATGAYGRIIYRVVGLGPQFLRDEIRVCFTHARVCFTPFQRVKQTHGFLNLFLNRQSIILLFLWVQVGS